MIKSVLQTPKLGAREQDLVARLAHVDRDARTSNCFGFAFYAAGLIPSERAMYAPDEIIALFARMVPVAAPQAGDVVAFHSTEREPVHAAIVTAIDPLALQHRFGSRHPVRETKAQEIIVHYQATLSFHRVYGMTTTPSP